jgi:hypothetical protein
VQQRRPAFDLGYSEPMRDVTHLRSLGHVQWRLQFIKSSSLTKVMIHRKSHRGARWGGQSSRQLVYPGPHGPGQVAFAAGLFGRSSGPDATEWSGLNRPVSQARTRSVPQGCHCLAEGRT